MFLTLILLALLLVGLVTLAIGIVLLIKVKNKLAGALITVFGSVFMLLPIGIYLLLTITTSVQGGM